MVNTAKQMGTAIGHTVYIRMESLTIPCTVMDVKNNWGKVRLLIRPNSGNGEQWVEMERIVYALEKALTVVNKV